ncbi:MULTISPECIES: hypothetical protein [Pseudomonadota]|jgi:hypothetical protein|uniref:Uncharacterized protein n=1 Tax=Ralstonia pickettii OR214 TaxID=1264675 RepID=R0DMQ8_RALPI|nr:MULTISPECIES: hypothetical protein [Pseudomonadota]MBE3061985.1 hypothetical protein [Cutibacterium acnes]OYT84261.1 MAG: hypothetical protein CFE46_19765 [Burkholderiales bacterium PBB6]ENZ74888.1 hypothetical protein OR214_05160 [Ralstonia pickettii OR214]MCM3583986.1 hypothetical protein [Ralstonia pickettii]MDR9387316.1 hypothetical protein [Ralstonia sp. 11b]
MSSKHLRIVADNTRDAAPLRITPEDVAHVDFKILAMRARYWTAFALHVLGMPFRLVAWICKFAVATGRGLIETGFKLVLGIIGLGFILVVGYGLLHVVLHPLFR